MNHRFASVVAVLALCLGVYAQKPDTKPTDMAAGKPDYSPESFVLEQVRTTYRFENGRLVLRDASGATQATFTQ